MPGMLVLLRYPLSDNENLRDIVIHDRITGEKITVSALAGSTSSRTKIGISASSERYLILRKEIAHLHKPQTKNEEKENG